MAETLQFELVSPERLVLSAGRPKWWWCRAPRAISAPCPAMRR